MLILLYATGSLTIIVIDIDKSSNWLIILLPLLSIKSPTLEYELEWDLKRKGPARHVLWLYSMTMRSNTAWTEVSKHGYNY